ncbi:NADH dehydrogenase [ubiquinone] 1 alpha subcomplex subunit 12 [Lingula anatina]|uniref:NADH dehydrogenase [ubiquinone] 1 alpha subcomplex subunit 12 n=1 Tax=Lingula anatina TaxID=7574 RepID=A0A1S3HDL0_LINAN|nr:NADH dehydrogenase [ubiquinone] 1 alpha subcomplex subunit 12 [Lingula anatina]|eukprot:XP_013384132.1 NADH dehydrogenase [ubiquinone] 1 alpha subcomplex subunit 12 [Lingula anatina]
MAKLLKAIADGLVKQVKIPVQGIQMLGKTVQANGGFFNGGLTRTVVQLYRMDNVKYGFFVGEDKYGNKYWQNDFYFFGSNRWVEYSPQVGMRIDASQIPAEWHRWLHYVTDIPPSEEPPVQHRWMADHEQNPTGTGSRYIPYSTTREKIEPWDPTQSKKQLESKR